MTRDEDNDRDYALWNLLILTRDAIYRVREKELTQYGITPEQSGALFSLSYHGDQATISKIGSMMLRRPHSVSNLLQRMEKHGLVKKQKPGNGRNPATYSLTAKGYEAYENSRKRESLYKALSALSEEEKSNLDTYLRKIMNQTFKDIANELKPPWP